MLLAGEAVAQPVLGAAPLARDGVIDLRGENLAGRSIPLKGEWTLYWHQLLTPATAAGATRTAMVDFPQLWSDTRIDGAPLPSMGYASYTLTVLLPPHHGPLALEVPSTYSAHRLFVNGELLAESGKPDTSAATAVPRWLEQVRDVPNGTDTLHVILQVANFWHSKGGPYKEMRIGDRELVTHRHFEDSAFDLLLTGCLLTGGLFFLGLYRFGERDKATLYFALFCIAYSYRVIGSRLYVLHALYPHLPWTVTLHLEYLSLFLGVAFFTEYTRHLFPDETPRLPAAANTLFCLAVSAVVVVAPPAVFTRLITPFLLVMFSVIGLALYIYIRAVQHRRLGANYALMSTGALLIVFVLINLEYFKVASPPKLALFIGYAGFFLLQSLILSFRFAYVLTRAKRDAELGAAAKSEFLSTMSHEIRTPLNAIIGMTHIIRQEDPRPDQTQRLDVLQYSASNLLTLVNDILDFSKIEAGKVVIELVNVNPADLARLLVEGQRASAEAKGIELRLQIGEGVGRPVLGDPTRMTQVLTNLVGNAIKFTTHGHVTLDIRVEHADLAGTTLRFAVTDTGIGIAPEKQHLIFEQFAQADASTSRQFGGSGLGLAICKRLLELQGSQLRLRSEPGKGSEFSFSQSFAFADASPATPAVPATLAPAEEHPLAGVTVLMAEDNPFNILVARAFLERWGAQVEVAHDGQQALDQLDERHHRVVLMDMHMPVMDGYEATRRMRANGVRLPIIALTASVPTDSETHLKATGLDGVVLKPIVPEDLLRVILQQVTPAAR